MNLSKNEQSVVIFGGLWLLGNLPYNTIRHDMMPFLYICNTFSHNYAKLEPIPYHLLPKKAGLKWPRFGEIQLGAKSQNPFRLLCKHVCNFVNHVK